METKIQKRIVTQIGILTADIQGAKAAWEKFLNLPSQPVSESFGYEITHAVYDGAPLKGRIYQVCYQFDNLELELIQPIGDTPSYWKECLDAKGPGIHHISFAVQNIDGCISECESLGLTLKQRGSWPAQEYPGGSYAYLDAMNSMNVVLELLEKEKEAAN